MADTDRSYADIIALLADNASGSISEQDIRDFVESMRKPFAGYYVSAPASTTIVTPGTYYKAAGTTAETNSNRFTVTTSNRMTYTGLPDRHFHIAYSVSMTCASNNQVCGLAVALNGAVLTGSEYTHKIGTAGDIASTAGHFDVMMSSNDYLELFVTNATSTGSVAVQQGYLFALGMFI